MIELTNGVQIAEDRLTQRATVSVDSLAGSGTLEVMQYDDTMPVGAITLTRKGAPWIPPEGAQLRIRMGKPDGHGVLNDALGMDADGTVYFAFTRQMTASHGTGQASIEVDVESGVKASAPFRVKIHKNPVQDDQIQSGDEILSLTQVIDAVHDAVDAANGSAVQAEQYVAEVQKIAAETETKMEAVSNELSDASTGYDGTAYASTGEAIRGQARQLHQDKEDAFRNLITPDAFLSGKNMFCSSEKLEDGMVQVTSSATYGRYDVRVKFAQALGTDQVIGFLARVFVSEQPASAFNIRPLIYAYSAAGDNYGEVGASSKNILTISQAGEYELYGYYRMTRDTVKQLDVGILMDKVGAQIGVYAYNLFVMSESDYQLYQNLNLFDFLDEQGYVDRVDHLAAHAAQTAVSAQTATSAQTAVSAQTAASAQTAVSAQSAASAESAEVARYAQNTELIPLDSFDIAKATGFAATISGVEGNRVSFPVGTYYSGVFVPCTLQPGARMLFVLEHAPLSGAAYLFCGVMNNSGSWGKTKPLSELEVDGRYYAWGVLELPESGFATGKIGFAYGNGQAVVGTDGFFDFVVFAEVEGDAAVTEAQVRNYIASGSLNYEIHRAISDLYNRIPEAAEPSEPTATSSWQGRNILFIGDSLTAAKKYPNTVKELLGINVFYHCKGGVGLLQMVDGDNGLGGDYDNQTDASGVLRPLSAEDVSGKDLIVLYGGYNNRGTVDGTVGDCYNPDGSGQSTIAGYMQYCINRIYEKLAEADNLSCRLLIVTVDCAGRYNYIDADGYEEWPADSGRTMETMANIQKAVAQHNSLLCLDLWHNSGINRHTWTVFGATSEAENPQYSPYRLNAQGEPESEERIRYVKGQSYYQIRDGAVVLEQYNGDAPYPYNGDQLHKSEAGYRRIGECIAGAILKGFGD